MTQAYNSNVEKQMQSVGFILKDPGTYSLKSGKEKGIISYSNVSLENPSRPNININLSVLYSILYLL